MSEDRHYDTYPNEDDFVTVECASCGEPWPCTAARRAQES